MTTNKRLIAISVIMMASLYAGFAHADVVHCDVRTIHATVDGGEFDEALNPLKSKLNKAFDGYAQFRLIEVFPLDLERDVTSSITLPNRRQLKLTYMGQQEEYIRLNLKIDDRLDTDLRIASGGTFFQAMNHDDGILIIAVTADTSTDETSP